MRVATIEDDRGGFVYIRPGDMFRDTRRNYLRILRVDAIEIAHAPVYLADCSIYVRFPAGMIGRPRPVRLLVGDLADAPYVRVYPDDDEAVWARQQRLVKVGA